MSTQQHFCEAKQKKEADLLPMSFLNYLSLVNSYVGGIYFKILCVICVYSFTILSIMVVVICYEISFYYYIL